jgi:predicted porin
MKLVKNSIALALATTLCTSTVFAEDTAVAPSVKKEEKATTDFYGKINISVQSTDEAGESKINELKSNASRVGIKGKYKLDHGLTAIYKLEWQVNVDDDSKDSLTARNQWVGVRGNFGEVTLGRADTTLKVSQGKFDLFNDYEGDLKHLFIGENRVTDSITYKSPVFSQVQILASLILSEDKELDNPFSVGVAWGDAKLKKTDFFLSLARDQNMQGKKSIYNTTRLTGMYKLSDLRLGAILTQSEINDATSIADGVSETGYAINASYKLGKFLPKVQVQEFAGAMAMNVGVDYKLGKGTKVYAWYTDREGLDFEGQTIKAAVEGTYIALGMEMKF